MSISSLSAQPQSEHNPLLESFTGLHATPPFAKIEISDYKPAIEKSLCQARSSLQQIIDSEAEPTFANTIEALEFNGLSLSSILEILFNLNEACTSDQMQALVMELTPEITAFQNDITLNEKLFERIKSVYEDRAKLSLTQEQARLLEESYKRFTRSGAGLDSQQKERYRELTTSLAQLSLSFNKNTLSATNAFTLQLSDSAEIEGLPVYVVEGAAEEARERSLQGWVITLQAPSLIPFLTYSPRRELREKLWRAYNTRCVGGEFDNKQIITQIVNQRLELAQLLGYNTYADYVLEERMAGSSETVNTFLHNLLGKAVDAAHEDVEKVSDFARSEGADFELMPWDFGYYSERLKQRTFDLSEEMTKPYFPLEKVQEAVFMLAGRLYGITLKYNPEIETYHSDVKAYEVFDQDGSFLAVLYLDYFPRSSKRGGAWMTSFRDTYTYQGEAVRPLVSVVCNFTKPTQTLPSLLTFDEVTTLLHEFGHALHGILAEGTYPSLTGTSVSWDFVELPSQIMENWASEQEFLDLWATHYQSGEKMPQELIDRIVASKNYLAAYSHLRQLSFGMSDMAWHSLSEPFSGDVLEFEREAMAPTQILPRIEGQCQSTAFGHIFSGGYAAGYYSYKWAEVLEADAFSRFQTEGIFNWEVATSLRENILSKGDSEPPMELYIRFMGREPDPEALFKKMGIE